MTDTQKGLLHAIIEEPEDDDLRLIYADWLEEQGDVERAEFIRTHVQLYHLNEAGEDFWTTYWKDVYRLLLRNGQKWGRELFGDHWHKCAGLDALSRSHPSDKRHSTFVLRDARQLRLVYRRGMVEEIHCDRNVWEQRKERLMLNPLEWVVLDPFEILVPFPSRNNS